MIGAFRNLPSNPSNESGSASSRGSGARPSCVDTQHELHDRFRIPCASTRHHLGLEKFFPELDRVVGSYLTQGERQIANSFHPTITFMAEISETEITLLDTNVYKGERFCKKSILDVQTHYKPKETFQFTNFYSCHPPGLTGGGGGALRLFRTNSSKETFEENIKNFESHLKCKGYPTGVTKKNTFSEKKSKLEQKNKAARKKILPFVTQYHPALPSLKKILVGKWHPTQNQPRLKNP